MKKPSAVGAALAALAVMHAFLHPPTDRAPEDLPVHLVRENCLLMATLAFVAMPKLQAMLTCPLVLGVAKAVRELCCSVAAACHEFCRSMEEIARGHAPQLP